MRWLRRRAPEPKGGKRAPPRRPFALSRRMQIAVRLGIGTAALGAVGAASAWAWQAGHVATATEAIGAALVSQTQRMGFAVGDVLLEGRQLAPREAVAAAVGLNRGDPIFGFDVAAMRKRLVAIPWIRDATVVRRLPDTVRITITERRPMALWQHNGSLALVDDKGVVISQDRRDLARFRHLLIVVGPDAPRHAPTVIAMIDSEPALARRVSAAVRIGQRRWNIELAGGVRVELPEHDPHDAWRRLAELDARDRLLERDVRTIDMRLPDRLIVRTGETGAQPAKAKGRNT